MEATIENDAEGGELLLRWSRIRSPAGLSASADTREQGGGDEKHHMGSNAAAKSVAANNESNTGNRGDGR